MDISKMQIKVNRQTEKIKIKRILDVNVKEKILERKRRKYVINIWEHHIWTPTRQPVNVRS